MKVYHSDVWNSRVVKEKCKKSESCLYRFCITWIVKHNFLLFEFGDERTIFTGVIHGIDAQNYIDRVIFVAFVGDFYRDSEIIRTNNIYKCIQYKFQFNLIDRLNLFEIR